MSIQERITSTITSLHAANGEAVEPGVVCNMIGGLGYAERRQVRIELDQMVRDGALVLVSAGPSYAYLPPGTEDARGRRVAA